MMGGDSSIYWGNGVGGVAGGDTKGRNDMGSRSSPSSRCVLLLFFYGLLVFVECPVHKSESLWTTPKPGVKSKRIALVAELMLICRSNQFRCCFLVQFLLLCA